MTNILGIPQELGAFRRVKFILMVNVKVFKCGGFCQCFGTPSSTTHTKHTKLAPAEVQAILRIYFVTWLKKFNLPLLHVILHSFATDFDKN